MEVEVEVEVEVDIGAEAEEGDDYIERNDKMWSLIHNTASTTLKATTPLIISLYSIALGGLHA